MLVLLASFCVWTKSLVCKDAAVQGIPLLAVRTIEPSRPDLPLSTVPFIRTPDRPRIIRPDDVYFRPDLRCFVKLLFHLAFVQTPLSDRSASDSFQIQFKGRLLQLSRRRGKNRNSNVTVRTSVSLGPDASSTVKEIADSTSTFRTLAFHGLNARIVDMEIAC
jgi:hypothetical protein